MSDDNGGFWRPVGVGRVTDEGLDNMVYWIGVTRTCAGIKPDAVLTLIEEVRAARAEIARLRAEAMAADHGPGPMAGHTPGPWVIWEYAGDQTDDGYPETAIQAHADEDGAEGSTVADVNRWGDVPEMEREWRANAALIAAAPDLLAEVGRLRAAGDRLARIERLCQERLAEHRRNARRAVERLEVPPDERRRAVERAVGLYDPCQCGDADCYECEARSALAAWDAAAGLKEGGDR